MPMRFHPSRPSLQEGRVEIRLDWDLDTWPPKPVETSTGEEPDEEDSARSTAARGAQ